MPEITIVEQADKIMYHVGLCGILVAAFCWGWNSVHFAFKKKG